MRNAFKVIVVCVVLVAIIIAIFITKPWNHSSLNLNGLEICLGTYSYNESGTQSSKIIWTVIDYDNNKGEVKLISKYVIDCIPFVTESTQKDEASGSSINVWSNSYIREWLNGYFYETAFNDDEKEYLLNMSQKILNYSREESGRREEFVNDKITLLTAKEAKSIDNRLTIATPFAISNNVFHRPDTNYAMWWLMSPGYYNNAGCYVDIYGSIRNGNWNTIIDDLISLDDDYCGVRPVITISYETFNKLYCCV